MAGTPQIIVVVTTDPGGAVVFRGKADTQGGFTAANLKPGKYIVEFRAAKSASLQRDSFAMKVAGGKKQTVANGVPGEKLGNGGVAMRVEVGRAGTLSGHIASLQPIAAAAPAGMQKVRANVKIMNGKRYVWVPGRLGSNMSGKWVEEGTEGAALAVTKEGEAGQFLRNIQDQSSNIGTRDRAVDTRPGDGR